MNLDKFTYNSITFYYLLLNTTLELTGVFIITFIGGYGNATHFDMKIMGLFCDYGCGNMLEKKILMPLYFDPPLLLFWSGFSHYFVSFYEVYPTLCLI